MSKRIYRLVFPNDSLLEHFQHALRRPPPDLAGKVTYSGLQATVPISHAVNWSDLSDFWGSLRSETAARVVGRKAAAELRALAKRREAEEAARPAIRRAARLERKLDQIVREQPRAARVGVKRRGRVGPPLRAQVSGRREQDEAIYTVRAIVPGSHYRIAQTKNGRRSGSPTDVRGDAREARRVVDQMRKSAPGKVVWVKATKRRK